jgi:Glucodextranase, domain B
VRPVSPSPDRLAGHRRIERRRSLPLPVGALLAVSIVVLGGFMLWVGSGAVGPFVSSMVRGFGGLVASVGRSGPSATPLPSGAIADAPVIEPPDQQYTRQTAVDITVHVSAAIAGAGNYTCRLWVTLPNAQPAIVTETKIGATSVLVLPAIALANGTNQFQASIVGPGGESKLSAPVTWILDTSKPKVTIISPANNSSAKTDTITIKGKTQAGSAVRISDATNGSTATATADGTGLFSGQIAVAAGTNQVTITVTDPAGNGNTATLTITRGTGQLRVDLTASAYQFKATKLPATVKFTATVTGADGHPLAGATALFTVTLMNLAPIVPATTTTDANGTATFSMAIPKGAPVGGGLATVQITTTSAAPVSARAVLTVQ